MTRPWHTIYANLAAHYGPQHWWQENQLADWLMMILVQRTNARNVALAMNNLQDVLSVDALLALPEADLAARIRPVGFYRQKAARIRSLLTWFQHAGGDFTVIGAQPAEQLRTELLAQPGIGPETADVMLLYTFGKKTFVADEYARRLSRRLGLGDYATYAPMHAALQPFAETLTLTQARELHALIDEHGKTQGRQPYDDRFLLVPHAPASAWPAQAVQTDGPHGYPQLGGQVPAAKPTD
ncbi:endonuclease III domain-containing protein [Schleiferilactobacillus shenzhenensis]|uniref:HhH-GPD domain-containing protein n=1 Tax=Schleiferilactobacillus shenzhenensis LY-73 TaxID=1231336 RepID=U4TQW2_9LACO|nr:hypothetical protein [Schleiferilactobacillus shenzhenensis]ERL65825.1 hypothetical protein L248_1901 [Schleiferilactobacillus shenzhenensis LY-73]